MQMVMSKVAAALVKIKCMLGCCKSRCCTQCHFNVTILEFHRQKKFDPTGEYGSHRLQGTHTQTHTNHSSVFVFWSMWLLYLSVGWNSLHLLNSGLEKSHQKKWIRKSHQSLWVTNSWNINNGWTIPLRELLLPRLNSCSLCHPHRKLSHQDTNTQRAG